MQQQLVAKYTKGVKPKYLFGVYWSLLLWMPFTSWIVYYWKKDRLLRRMTTLCSSAFSLVSTLGSSILWSCIWCFIHKLFGWDFFSIISIEEGIKKISWKCRCEIRNRLRLHKEFDPLCIGSAGMLAWRNHWLLWVMDTWDEYYFSAPLLANKLWALLCTHTFN